MRRDLDRLTRERFDLLVIGGGVLGASVARDAALRGLSVALVERDDFGSGASANSLKIVHGGLRHLRRLDLGRVREGVRERATWLRIAPHLVEPLPVLVPTRRGGRPPRSLLRFVVALNDALSWDRNADVPPDRRLPAGRAVSPAEVARLVPELEGSDTSGGILFHDAQMYSSERLVLELVESAAAAGAAVANYVGFRAAAGAGRFEVVDGATGDSFRIRSSMVVNAAGADADAVIRGLVGGPGGAADAPPAGPQSLAINVVVRGRGHRVAFAVPAGSRADDPLLFAAPWRDRLLIGTGHYAAPAPGSEDAVARAVETFLAQLDRVWPGARIEERDVCLVHHGFIPTQGDPRAGIRFLRRPRILDHARAGAPAISALTGKFTTARRAAELVVDRIAARLGRSCGPCTTAAAPLPGAPADSLGRLLATARRRHAAWVADDVLDHLVRSHGRRYERVLELAREPAMRERLHADAPVIRAQWAYAIRDEMALRPEDLVWRRTELGARGLATDEVLASARELSRLCPARQPCPTR